MGILYVAVSAAAEVLGGGDDGDGGGGGGVGSGPQALKPSPVEKLQTKRSGGLAAGGQRIMSLISPRGRRGSRALAAAAPSSPSFSTAIARRISFFAGDNVDGHFNKQKKKIKKMKREMKKGVGASGGAGARAAWAAGCRRGRAG
ncbi:hypothetical protein ACMD2_12315 [Ananas comosus]|uniref:Uncharacterized protein n=1 Tax=Ananas comosus TaxID=4615 RepID=A0A199W7G1_ANACO|nr:hypothetical protein ACMD2_12315 [Ananas comosus]